MSKILKAQKSPFEMRIKYLNSEALDPIFDREQKYLTVHSFPFKKKIATQINLNLKNQIAAIYKRNNRLAPLKFLNNQTLISNQERPLFQSVRMPALQPPHLRSNWKLQMRLLLPQKKTCKDNSQSSSPQRLSL